ncbi:MAG: hypothetical protein F4Y62_07805 [Rhodospirillaceae bacterium]|nr:hypothetical protein [Rhodospirillaceae bacterium]MYF86441.1 hypothetical protein [Rhodospirillaceae bacterium]MYK13856.1 hypothetical protein [Rhodospirillaceae bacterium]
MTRISRPWPAAALAALHIICMAASGAPAAAMQILDAADHAEIAAEISATNVNRIALMGDRIAKVVRAPDGYAVEHDGASGDLYLRPVAPGAGSAEADPLRPVTLFIGTERGFTYRLTLTPAARDSAQILIRNAEALPNIAIRAPALADNAHVAALVRLVRAVARREPLPGHAIEAARGRSVAGFTLIETWRGPRFAALVLEADALPLASGGNAAAGLAGTIGEALADGALADGARLAALWLASAGTGPSGGRLAVAVVDTARTGESR